MKTLRWSGLLLSSAILAGCSSSSVPSDRDFAFTFFDLSANADGAAAPDLSGPSNDDLAGADLSGADLSAAADMAIATDAAQANADSGGTTTAVALTLNEVNPRITGGADEVELLAHGAGSISGWTLTLSVKTSGVTPVVVAMMPDLTVADGDFVLVHLKPATTLTSETTAGGKAGCTDGTCVATAWDIAGSANDLTDSARVLTLSNAAGTIVDGLAYSNAGGGATWPAQLQALQADQVWDPTPCGNTCATTDADALAVATGSTSTGVQSSVAGKSMQRANSTIPSTKADWTIKASTWGAAN